jgi:hypothetical protein
MIAANGLSNLRSEVQAMTDPKNGNLARKAQGVLEKM